MDEIRIGASSTHAEVAASALVAGRMPALAELASRIGDPGRSEPGNHRRIHRECRPWRPTIRRRYWRLTQK